MDALGASTHEIDIKPAAMQMLRDLDHPAALGERLHDVTYENVQAGARTSLLFRLANQQDALVLGTGDLSELALGWCTYGVGDHMSHYGVNASVPKTLIQYLVQWVSEHEDLDDVTRTTLDDDPRRPACRPSWCPTTEDAADEPAQLSESVVGPYELQDFFLYHVLRFGFRPSKVAYLAHHAWRDRDDGDWPAARADAPHNEYDLAQICHWLRVFLQRFFATTSSNDRRSRTGPKSAREAPCRREATGEHRATCRRRPGSRSSTRSKRVCSDLPDPSDQAACSRSSSSQAVAQRKSGIDDLRGLAGEVLEPGVRAPGDVDREPDRARWLVVLRCRTGDPRDRDTDVGLEQLRHVLRHGCDRPLGHHRTVGHVEQGALHFGRVGHDRATVPVRGTLGGREAGGELTTGERLRHGQPRPFVTQESADRRDVRVLRLCHGLIMPTFRASQRAATFSGEMV